MGFLPEHGGTPFLLIQRPGRPADAVANFPGESSQLEAPSLNMKPFIFFGGDECPAVHPLRIDPKL
jgi:hypothetical protein